MCVSKLNNKLKNVKGILFDLDGTLVDSMWMWSDIDKEFLEEFGIRATKDLATQIAGMSFTETAIYFKNYYQLDMSVEDMKDAWNKMALYKYTNEVPMKKGAKEFLYRCQSHGIKLGIGTSNSRILAEAVLRTHDIIELFDSIVTACDVEVGKPNPDIYLKVAKDLGIKASEAIVFEDIIEGIQAGRAAGIEVCAVDDEFTRALTGVKKDMSEYYIYDYDGLLL